MGGRADAAGPEPGHVCGGISGRRRLRDAGEVSQAKFRVGVRSADKKARQALQFECSMMNPRPDIQSPTFDPLTSHQPKKALTSSKYIAVSS